MLSDKRDSSASSRCCVQRTPRSRPTGRGATRRTSRSSLQAMSSRSPRWCVTCGVVTRTVVSPPGRSACWPRPVRFSCPSSRSQRRPMRTRLRPSSTRFSLPERTMPDQAWPEELSADSALPESASSEPWRSDRAQPDSALNVVVILVAAGSGVRLGGTVPKAFASLRGEPLLAHALRGVLGCAEVGHVIIVGPASHLGRCREVAGGYPRVDVVAGGADRSASVEAGLAALRHDDGIVLVHDVARCLAPPDLFARVIRAVRDGHPAVVPGLPVTDTVKVVDPGGRVLATPDRQSLRGIQTPQGFRREVLENAHASHASATDDAGLVERSGGLVRVVTGDQRALKITSPVDLTLATALLRDGSYAG